LPAEFVEHSSTAFHKNKVHAIDDLKSQFFGDDASAGRRQTRF
jgi:hypothetical protein